MIQPWMGLKIFFNVLSPEGELYPKESKWPGLCPPPSTASFPKVNYERIFSSFFSWISFIAISNLIQSKVFVCRFAAKFGQKNYSISASYLQFCQSWSATSPCYLPLCSYILAFNRLAAFFFPLSIQNCSCEKVIWAVRQCTFVRIKRRSTFWPFSLQHSPRQIRYSRTLITIYDERLPFYAVNVHSLRE